VALEVLIPRQDIQARIAELARTIRADFGPGTPIHFVAVLKGAFMFLSELIRAIDGPVTCDFIAVSSYGASTKSSGEVRLVKDVDTSLAGRHVVIVEDIVDTGLTLGYLVRTLSLREPASLSAVTLLDRPHRRLVDDVPLLWIGFTVPDELFAGYGLGLDERWRALPDLHVVVSADLPAVIAS
jgi:hypoxanthine phosphoribosyltransferase